MRFRQASMTAALAVAAMAAALVPAQAQPAGVAPPFPDLAARMQGGLWAQTVTVTTNGLARPPRRTEVCAKPTDFNNTGRLFGSDTEANPECRAGLWVRNGATARRHSECNAHGMGGVIDVALTLTPPVRYSGTINTTSTVPGRTIKRTIEIEGVRIGECKK